MRRLEKTINELLVDYEFLHTDFQIDNFIIGGAGDDWAKYKQTLSEISTRYNSILAGEEELEIARLSRPGFRLAFTEKRRALHRVKIARWERSILATEFMLTQTKRELARLVENAVRLKKNFINLSKERRAELETESWRNKAIYMSAMDLLVNRGISHTTMDFILKLPKDARRMVINVISPDARPDPFKLLGMNDD